MRSKGGSLPFSAGQTILSEGDPGKEMFVIEEGQVELFRRVAGEVKRVAVLEHGDFFGEMSVVDDLPRGALSRPVPRVPPRVPLRRLPRRRPRPNPLRLRPCRPLPPPPSAGRSCFSTPAPASRSPTRQTSASAATTR